MGLELRLELRQIQHKCCSNCDISVEASDIYSLYIEYLPVIHCCVGCYKQLIEAMAPSPSTVLIKHHNYDEGKTYISERRYHNGHFPT